MMSFSFIASAGADGRRRLLRAAPYAAAAVTVLFGFMVLDLHRDYARLADESRRYSQGTRVLNRTYLQLKDVESHHRGYLLTGDSTFLPDYEAARRRAQAELASLDRLVRTEEEQAGLQQLKELAKQRLDATQEVLRVSALEGRGAAAEMVAEGVGRRAMDQFEDALELTSRQLAELQEQGERDLQKRFNATLLFIVVGTAGATLAGVTSGRALTRHAEAEGAAADRLRAANAQLQRQAERLREHRTQLESQAMELEGQALELELQTQELAERNSELSDRETRFRALVEEAPHLILTLDEGGRITYATPATVDVLATSDETLRGRRLPELLHQSAAAEGELLLAEVLSEPGAERPLELRFATAGGGWRLLSGRARNLTAEPAVRGVVINCHDVTQQRSVEGQLQHAQKMEAIGRLAGGVAHDFNNLLTSISGYAGLAADALDSDSPALGDLQEVQKAAELAASLTRQLLAFSRQQVTQPELLDINDIVAGSAGLLRRLLGPSIQMVTRLEPALHPVFMDAGQISQVIMNLAVNARDAMPEGGRLVIETSNAVLDAEHAARRGVQPGRYALISVTDNGEGMPPEVQARIFEPFFTTKEQGKGTGLGLSTAYGVAQQAGGYIWVYSELGSGTTFKIYLPAAEGREQAEARTATRHGKVDGGGILVLLVEDDESVRRFASRALERTGFEVLTAAGAAEALEMLAAHPDVGLVVTDIIMPGMSGAALGRQLAERFPELPVLYTSGYPRDEMSSGGSIPADVAFIGKPYSADELAQTAARLLGRDGR